MQRESEIARVQENHQTEVRTAAGRWYELAEAVLAGHRLSSAQGLDILRSAEVDLLELLAGVYRVRRHWRGNRVHLNFLVNAKSGHCGEDCGYCSQAKTSHAQIEKYDLLSGEEILRGAHLAAQRQAATYCIVTSGRGPRDHELATLEQVVPRIKQRHGLQVCVSPGLLTGEQALRLKACGVDRVNHNLNTSERFYPRICTTHTYQQRIETLRHVRSAGLQICSGGIVGMGEEDEDVVALALALGRFQVEALPVNFLIPIPGTPLQRATGLNPRRCLKILALFRLANPRSELRVSAGREQHLGALQPLALYAADSMFVGDYLTTGGQPPSEDYRMIEALGFEVVAEGSRSRASPAGGGTS